MMLDELAKRARIDVAQLKPGKRLLSNATNPLIQKARPPSTLRLAITLLIQQPALAKQIQEPLPPTNIRGFDLLLEIIETAKQHPDLTTGGLLEFWRERKEGPSLAKLAQTEHMISDEALQNEFLGAIQCLRKIGHEQLIERLLAKANQTDLSPEEKQQLGELIRSK